MTPNELLIMQCRPDKVMPIFQLWRAVWRWVFDEINCPLRHRQEVEKEILKWDNIVKTQKRIRLQKYGPQAVGVNLPTGTKGNPIDELEYQVGMMCKTLVDNENGLWDHARDTLRIHHIDYKRSIHCKKWFPECQDPDAAKKGQAILEQHKKDNPEDYRTEG